MGLSLYGDPDELDKLAKRIRGHAAEVRQRAADHVRNSANAHWVSAAATAYREQVARDRASAERAAEELDRAADVLQAHAQHVRETIAQIARIEKEAAAWFDHQARSLADKVEHVVDSAGDLLRKVVSDPPWKHWPFGPHNLPPSGDAKWLDVGHFLRGKGAIG